MNASYARTGSLLRLALRRDRIRLPIWVFSLGIFTPYIMVAYDTVFSNPSDMEAILAMMASPSMALFTGPGYGLDTLVPGSEDAIPLIFAGVYWLYLMAIVALMSIMLMTRHTRREEEAGRSELIRASAVGSRAPLTSSLLLVFGVNLLVGAITTAGLIGAGCEASSSLLVGVTTMLVGWFFAGVAAVTAQLSAFSGAANGLAGAVLGFSFVIRGVGDMIAPVGEHGTWLSWISPMGWAQQTRAFYDDRWWPTLLLLGGTLVLVAFAYTLSARRDLGAGMLKVRHGKPTAAGWLSTPPALAWAIQRPLAMGWTIGLILAAIMYGSFTEAMVTSFNDLPDLFQSFMGGADGALEGYLTLTVMMFRVTLAAYAVSAIGKLVNEERGGRLEPVLATPVRPNTWLLSHVAIITLVAAVLAIGLAVIGGAFAAASGDDVRWIADAATAGAAGIPSVLIVLGLAAALYAVGPRWVTLAWIPVVLGAIIELFGDLLQLPEWARQISPFEHTPDMPAQAFELSPVLIQCAVAIGLVVIAWWQFGRRDIPSA